MCKPDQLRVAYHEAGHALLAVELGTDFNDFKVTIYSAEKDGKLGVTEYLRDKTKNLNQDMQFGRNLITLAWGGCIGEKLYCEQNAITVNCKYGEDDNKSVDKIINQMLLSSDKKESDLKVQTKNRAQEIIESNKEYLKQIAKMLYESPDKTFYYCNISEIMRPMK
jgi:ATP-dependent Zn protease